MGKIIGLDVGGTKISGVLFDGKKVLKELTIKTPDNLFEFERNLLKLADFLSVGSKVSGVGIGMAGLMDFKKGIAIHSPNIKFVKNLFLRKLFQLNGYKNVEIENDARCFALSESLIGYGKNKNNVVCLTLGTGIGGGLVYNGKLIRGSHFGAGEVGHMIYEGQITFEKAFQKARDRKDNRALANIVGNLLTNIYRLTDPDLIVLGGGVAMSKNRNFINEATKKCAKNLVTYKIKPQVKTSKLKNAGAIGAALLVG